MKPYFYIHTNASKHITNRTDRSTAWAHPCWISCSVRVHVRTKYLQLTGFVRLVHSKRWIPNSVLFGNPRTTSIYSNNKRHKSHEILVKFQLNPIQSHEFPIFAGEIPIFLLVLSREFSGMIHFITSNNHPSNPQQPIHSLLSTSETLLTKKHRIGWWENLQETPIFDGKNHGFRLRFSQQNQSNDQNSCGWHPPSSGEGEVSAPPAALCDFPRLQRNVPRRDASCSASRRKGEVPETCGRPSVLGLSQFYPLVI